MKIGGVACIHQLLPHNPEGFSHGVQMGRLAFGWWMGS